MGMTAGDLYAKKIVKSAPRAKLFLELLQLNEVDDSYLPVIEKAENICLVNGWKSKEQIAQALQQACEELDSQPNQVSENHGIVSKILSESQAIMDEENQIIAAQIYSQALNSLQRHIIERNFTNPTAIQIKQSAESGFRNFLGTVSNASKAINAVKSNAVVLAAIEAGKE